MDDATLVSLNAKNGRILRSSGDVEPYVAQVANWADKNRDSFGFLPASTYAEAAARGRLWVAVNKDGSLMAYLFFGGRFPNISVTQLFVSVKARGLGVGYELIQELKKYAQLRVSQTISARVAADLEANLFWEKSDFLLVRQLKGGQAKNRIINVRVYEVPQSSLWSENGKAIVSDFNFLSARPPSLVPNYVLDLNVFFDVVKNRVEAESGLRLMSAAMANKVRLCVTSEFATELERNAYDIKNDPVLNLAKSLPTLPEVPLVVLSTLIPKLRPIVFPEIGRSSIRAANDNSDLIHLASCIHHRTSGFVTREKAILRAADFLEKKYQLEVVSPADILPNDDDRSLENFSLKALISGASLHLQKMSEDDRSQTEFFLQNSFGMTDHDMRQALDPGTNRFPKIRLIGKSNDDFMGFCSFNSNAINISEIAAFIVVDENNGLVQQFIDHVLQKLSAELPEKSPCFVSITTLQDQHSVVTTALSRAYVVVKSGDEDNTIKLNRLAFKGIITSTSWGEFKDSLAKKFDTYLPDKCPSFLEAKNTGIVSVSRGVIVSKPRRLMNFETFFCPLLLVLPDRPGTIVPIWDVYASELLNLPISQMSLLPSKEAPLRIERVYFGRPGFEKAFVKDGIVVFYISGNSGGRKQAVGLARITSTGRVGVAKAQREFSRHGVFEDEKFENAANKKAELGMITFDNFVLFPKPVSCKKLTEMKCIGGANLVTAQKLSYIQLMKIIEAGFK